MPLFFRWNCKHQCNSVFSLRWKCTSQVSIIHIPTYDPSGLVLYIISICIWLQFDSWPTWEALGISRIVDYSPGLCLPWALRLFSDCLIPARGFVRPKSLFNYRCINLHSSSFNICIPAWLWTLSISTPSTCSLNAQLSAITFCIASRAHFTPLSTGLLDPFTWPTIFSDASKWISAVLSSFVKCMQSKLSALGKYDRFILLWPARIDGFPKTTCLVYQGSFQCPNHCKCHSLALSQHLVVND